MAHHDSKSHRPEEGHGTERRHEPQAAPLHHHGADCGCSHGSHKEHASHHDHDHSHDHSQGHSHHHHEAAVMAAAFPWSRVVPSFLLALWGGVMIYFFASGRIVHYLTGFGGFRVQALICGLLLCVLAAFELFVREPRSSQAAHDHGSDDAQDHGPDGCAGCGHDHDHDGSHDHDHGSDSGGGWMAKAVTFLVLALPLSAAAVFTPDQYSEQFAINKAAASVTSGANALSGGGIDLAKRAEKSKPLPGASTPDGGSSTASKPPANPNAFSVEELERLSGGRTPQGNIPLQLVELFYMPAQTRDVQEVVSTQTIETTGQAIKDKQDPTRMRLFRLMMTCCAADARPISIPVEFAGATPEWREMAWYTVTGTVEYRDVDGTPTTIFKATSLTPSKPPRQQMMY